MPTIFTRIVKGEIPCYKVAESDRYLAFLDINPLAVGHTLVIPKAETDYIFDIGDEKYQEFFLFTTGTGNRYSSVPMMRTALPVSAPSITFFSS